MKKPVPILYQAGTPQYPRLCVAQAECEAPPHLFWNNDTKSWVCYEQATLFIDLYLASLEARKILQEQYAGLPIRTFVVPIEIQLYGDLKMSSETFRQWLTQSVNFTVNNGNYGNGPTENSCALAQVLWDQMREAGIDSQETD